MAQNTQFFPLGGNHLSLDLINTECLIRRKRTDLLTSSDMLEIWWSQVISRHEERIVADILKEDVEWNDELLVRVKWFRSVLRNLFTNWTTNQTINVEDVYDLNQILSMGYHFVRISKNGCPEEAYETTDKKAGGVLYPVALSAFRLLTGDKLNRVRACPNCIGIFLDTTKSGTKKWCSEKCMNRARSRERYAQIKKMRENNNIE